MALPIRPLVRPSILDGHRNGQLPSDVLTEVAAPPGPPVVLLAPAAHTWRAMAAACEARTGEPLHVGGAGRSYRDLDQQEATFLARYVPDPAGPIRWDRRRWRKRPGVAVAARPGTSNHGLGLAVDIKLDPRGKVRGWLESNAPAFGWSAEVPSEPWHWRHYVGDIIPPAVAAFYALTDPDPTTETDPDNMLTIRHDTTLNIYWSVDPAGRVPVKDIDDPASLELDGVPVQRSAAMRYLMAHHFGRKDHRTSDGTVTTW